LGSSIGKKGHIKFIAARKVYPAPSILLVDIGGCGLLRGLERLLHAKKKREQISFFFFVVQEN